MPPRKKPKPQPPKGEPKKKLEPWQEKLLEEWLRQQGKMPSKGDNS